MDATLSTLLSPSLDPLFLRPVRLGVVSAWTAHVPFAHWIVAATRPRLLVELGTHCGMSYAAFCEAVLQLRLDTRCLAVDTWQGDAHSGLYGEEVYADLRQFHDRRYAAFSELVRGTFDSALDYLPDGAVDLLHIDGCHDYDAVRHDFESWRPKLSDRAVVLLHDTNVRERGFGVWRLFDALRAQYPAFEFLHGHGLGVLAVGAQAPASVVALCELADSAQVTLVRERFSQLGERWRAEQQLIEAREASDALSAQLRAADEACSASRKAADTAVLQSAEAARQADDARQSLLAAEARLADMEAERDRLAETAARLAAHQRGRWPELPAAVMLAARIAWWTLTLQLVRRLRARMRHRRDLALLESSRLFNAEWYLRTYPDVADSGLSPARHFLRYGLAERRNPGPLFDSAFYLVNNADVGASGFNPLIHYLLHGAGERRRIAPVRANPDPANAGLAPLPGTPPTSASSLPRVVWFNGESDNRGAAYRVDRPARAAERAGAVVSVHLIEEARACHAEVLTADVVVIWRAEWSEHVAEVVESARIGGARVLFDVDDLMIDPKLARLDLIDGIRTQNFTEAGVRHKFSGVRDTMALADLCLATTEELALAMRRHELPVIVLPNGYDEAVWRASRRAARQRRASPGDGLIRLGYAGGSRTHQKDFAQAAAAVARILRAHPRCRLVLFQSPVDGLPVTDPAEYPALAGLEAQIEWRDLVPLEQLPLELARFDINLAPLEIGNPFCEAKSELKYFEAALVDVPTVASPTGPYRRAMEHGRTGFLAADEAAWLAALDGLVRDPELRRRIGLAARLDVLWPYGPERRVERIAAILAQARGGPGAARAFALELHRARAARPTPPMPEAETVFERDALGDADVTVLIPLYNYADHVTEALDSVAAQTLGALDLIVIDDRSTDASLQVALNWVRRNAGRFNRVLLLRNEANAGLGPTRNLGFAMAETPYVLPLDADNRLRPACCERLLAEATASGAAFVYPVIEKFGDETGLMGAVPYQAARLIGMPFIDAMALVSVAAWAGVGGYWDGRLGWEDFELWCRMAEAGLAGQHAAGEPLADYRVHGVSMLRTVTNIAHNQRTLWAAMKARHAWLELVAAALPEPVDATQAD